jgi:hypothetical protein
MFIGHFGTAFASKKIDNRISLGTTFLAAQFLDLLWPIFVLLGIEKVAIEPGNRSKSKMIGLWALIILLAVIYIANLFGPPPPSVNAIAYSALGMWLIILWAYWVDSGQ